MSGEERLLQDIQADEYKERTQSLGDLYHELRVALHRYTIGEITLSEYNAKIEKMEKFLERMKYDTSLISRAEHSS